MPYPKGINQPEIRAAWLADRRKTVQSFDRLVDEGIPRYKAAQAIGTDASSIEAMRRSIEHLEQGNPLVGRAGNNYIDLGLSLLSCLLKPGEALTSHDIAAWCGCSHAAIKVIEKRALRKVRRRLVEGVDDQELGAEIRDLLARNVMAF